MQEIKQERWKEEQKGTKERGLENTFPVRETRRWKWIKKEEEKKQKKQNQEKDILARLYVAKHQQQRNLSTTIL